MLEKGDSDAEPFVTLDVYLAAWLRMNGQRCEYKSSEMGRVSFWFQSSPELRTLCEEATDRDTVVRLPDYVAAIKGTRSMMHAEKDAAVIKRLKKGAGEW